LYLEFWSMLYKEVRSLISKDIRLELKQKYVLNGILLYLLSTVFVTYLAFEEVISAETWNSLFWVILLFVGVNGISKSFIQESPARYIYYYTIVSPQAVVLAKILYNLFLMAILALLSFGLFLLLMGNKVIHMELFLLTLLLGSFGLSCILTMVAAIASRAGNNFSLMAILSFPIILPLLLMLMKVSRIALEQEGWVGSGAPLIILLTINVAVISLAYILFPYLWRNN